MKYVLRSIVITFSLVFIVATNIVLSNESDFVAAGDNPFGVFLPHDLSSKDKLGPAKELGINKTRIVLRWEEVEPTRNQFDFSFYDFYINKLYQANIMPVITVKSRSSWGTRELKGEDYEDLSTSSPPQNWVDYENFLRILVNRYKDKVKYWQIENEIVEYSHYWSGSNEEYIELLQHAYKTIKQCDPNANVVLQGFAHQMFKWIDDGNKEAFDFFNYMMSNGEYFDVIDFHQYFEPEDVLKEINTLKETMKAYGYRKPIICTEAGGFDLRLLGQQIKRITLKDSSISEISIAKNLLLIPDVFNQLKKYREGGLSNQEWIDFGLFLKQNVKSRPLLEKYQAEDLIKRISLTLSQGVEFVEWVPMTDFKKPKQWYFSHLGLIDSDGRKKPHFYTYKLLIDKLEGFTHVEEMKASPRVIKFDFAHKSSVCIVWSKTPTTVNMNNYFSGKKVLLTKIVIELDEYNNPIYPSEEIIPLDLIQVNQTPIFIEENK